MPTIEAEPRRDTVGVDPGSDFCRQQEAILAFSRRASQPSPLPVLMEDSVIIGGAALRADLGLVAMLSDNVVQADVVLPEARGANAELRVASLQYGLADQSMVAESLRAAEPVFTADLLAEGRFQDPALVRLGIVGALTLPLFVNVRPMGAIAFYTRRAREWKPQAISFAETIAHLLTAALARQRAEDKLREERDVKSALLEMVDTIVLTLDQDGRIRHINRACECVTRFTLDELRGRCFWETLIVPREAELVRSLFLGSRGGRVPSEFAGSLLGKDGTSRHVSWSLRAMGGDEVQSIVLLGSDRTDHFATTQRLQQMTSVARHAIDAYFGGPSSVATTGTRPARTSSCDTSAPVASGISRERRASVRHPYPYTQTIMPIRGATLPSPDARIPVQCQDVSASGVAFFLKDPPDFEQFTVTLGRPPVSRQIRCRVVRVAACEIDGSRRYLIGCRFIECLQ